ncbi:MAG: sugar ABC transporter permease [Christensenellaceae bacterium]|nr:sugar ABC transporter permease [Christensenellaceae bacterium]
MNDTTATLSRERLELKERSWFYKALNTALKCPYVLIAPAIIVALWMVIYPIFFGLYASFTKWDMFTKSFTWVGLANYKFLLVSEDFWKTMGNTLLYMVVFVLAGISLNVLLGVFLNKNKPAHNLIQTIMFTPHIISFVSVALIWLWLMQPANGILNYVLNILGLKSSYWYRSADSSLLSILIVALWKGMGYGVLVVISGLRSIPQYVYEAARLDKSSKPNTFFKITLPLLSPTLFFLIVTSVVSSFCTYDVVALMTKGGTDNSSNLLAYYIYQQGFLFGHFGRAMAASMILLVMTSVISFLNFKFAGKEVHYQ